MTEILTAVTVARMTALLKLDLIVLKMSIDIHFVSLSVETASMKAPKVNSVMMETT